MTYIVIGNIVALVASLLMVYSGIIKNKKRIIYAQTIQISLFVISNIILGGIVGAIINILNCIRNIICYKNKLGLREKIIISLLSISLSLLFNNLGIIGLLPLIGSMVYLWLMNLKDVIIFKYVMIFTMILWFIYDFYIKSYTSTIFDILTIITNIVAIIELRRLRKLHNND